MTKRQIRTMIASAVAVVLLLAVYCIQGLSTLKTDEAEGVCVYSMDPDSITAIRFSGAGGPVSLVRTADGWCWEEDAAFPLNQNFVDTMLEKTATLQVLRQVAEGKDAYAAYGLDNPSNVITITSQEQDRILYLGDTNGTTGDCYLSVEGSDVVYTVDSTFPTLFSSSINDMAVRETLPGITTEDITAFSVTRGAEEISFQSTQEEAGDQQRWTVNQNGAVYEADTGLVTELFSKIIQLRYTHMEVYQPKDAPLAACGLKPAAAVLEVSYALEAGTPQTSVLPIGARRPDGESRYVYTPDGQGIYTVQADSLEELLQLKAESFLSMDVFPVRPEELAQLHITAPNGTVTFQADHSGDAVRYTCNDAEITEAEFNSFYFVLYAMEAEKRVGDLSDQLTQAPVMTMEYQRVAGDSHLTELIPYDQNYYAVRTDGTAVLLVNRTTVNTLLSTLDPYLAK